MAEIFSRQLIGLISFFVFFSLGTFLVDRENKYPKKCPTTQDIEISDFDRIRQSTPYIIYCPLKTIFFRE